MASKLNFFLMLIFFNLILALESTRAPFNPNSLVLPTRKDPSTNLHITNIHKRTPQVSIPFLIDLNGRFLWLTCEQNYSSSTYNAPFCHSTQCSRAGTHFCRKCTSPVGPGCHNNTCGVTATNPLTRRNADSELAEDVISIQSIQRSQWVTIPHFLFACSPPSLLQGPLPQGVRGIAGLGHTPVSLPIQLASHSGFQRQFSICLSSSNQNNGGIFFGNAPPTIQPRSLTYTPLSIGAQGEYFVLVKSIIINHKTVQFNTSLLSTTRGFKGTMISTTTPYTILQHSIYQRFTQFFANEMSGTPQVQAVPPFGLCFNSRYLPPTRVGTPNIEFVFQNRNLTWTIYGVDALVMVRPNVSCLGFVDGGLNTRAPIIIGANQIENNFLHFDLMTSRLGFVPSRLTQPVNCSNFNFTSDDQTLELDEMED